VARDGRATITIVLNQAKAIPAEKTAARELAHYLKKITGATFQVVNEDTLKPGTSAIYLGDTAKARALGIDPATLGAEESILRTVGPDLIVTGGRPRGTLYGVYILLEEVLGCRWYTPWCEKVRPQRTCTIGQLNVRRKPCFAMRDIYGPPIAGDIPPHGSRWQWWTVRNRLNGPNVGRGTWYRSKYFHSPIGADTGGGWVLAGAGAHTFAWFFPTKDYFDKHPEFYSMRKGKRVRSTSSNGNHLCLTNRRVQELMTEKVVALLRKIPNADCVTVSINDGGHNTICDCPACRAVAQKHGESGLLVQFLNPIADVLRRDLPGKYILTLAYNPTAEAPRGVTPRDNIIVHVCGFPLACRVYHPDLARGGAMRLFKDWCRVAKHVWTWDKYNQAFYTFSWLKPLWWHIDENVKLMKTLGVTGVCPEDEMVSMDPVIAELYEMRAWLLAKLAEKPDQDADALIKDFVHGYVGPAGPFLFDYLMLQKQRRRRWPWRMVDYGYVHRAQTLFDRAEAAVARDAALLARVKELRVCLDVTTLVFRSQVVRDYLRGGGRMEAYPYPRQRIGERVLHTLDHMTHPYWTFPATKWALGAYRKGSAAALARPIVERLAQGPEYAPLPEALRHLPPDQVIEIPMAVQYSHKADCLVVDPQAALGVAFACARTSLPFESAVWGGAASRFLSDGRLLGRQDVQPGGYHLYKGGRFVMGPNAYLYLTSTWTPQVHMHTLYDPAKPDELWEYYVSVRFAGLETGDQPTGVFVDRVFLVRLGTVKDVLKLGSGPPPPSLRVLGRWPMDGDGVNFAPDVETERMPDARVQGAAWVPGRFGKAIAFAKRTDAAVVPFDRRVKLSDKSFTISLWFRTDSTAYGQVLIEQYADNKHFLTVRVQAAKTLNFQVFDPAADNYHPLTFGGRRTDPTDGKWHHVLVGYDRTRKRMFACLDGIELAEKALGRLPDVEAPIRIGSGSTGFLRGAVDEVRIYGEAICVQVGGR